MAQAWGRDEWVQAWGPLLTRLLVHHLCVRPRERKVLVCEPLAGPTAAREALAHVLFQWLKVPALGVVPALTTPLYTAGAEGGLVVDVGFRECHVLAVAFGRPLLHTYTVAGVGAMDVLTQAQALLKEEEEEDLPVEVLQDVVTRACFVPSRKTEGEEETQASPITYKEGGVALTLTPRIRGTVADGLFAEEGDEGASLPVAVLECLRKCPRDLRRSLAGHVLVVGGAAMLPGFGRRLAQEVKHQVQVKTRYQELCPVVLGGGGGGGGGGLCVVREAALLAPRNVLAWVGGSILAVLEETVADSSLFVDREDYLASSSSEVGEKSRSGTTTTALPDWLAVSGDADSSSRPDEN